LTRDPERYSQELKSYALTEANAKAHAPKLAETIAAIANHGQSSGVVVCAGSEIATDAIIDGAKLDDLVNRTVHPRVLVSLTRLEIDGRTVDFIIVPRSNLRPHIVRGSDGRYFVPFRGIANNSTAARAELDAIYREMTIEMIRQAMPGVSIGEDDPLGKYLDRISYGLGKTDAPQLAFVVAPSSVPKRLIENKDLLSPEALRTTVLNLTSRAINEDFTRHQDWFSTTSGITSFAQEDYAAVAQVQSVDDGQKPEYLWGARIYVTGVVSYSTIIYPTDVSMPPGAFPIDWFERMASATLAFARLAYEAFALPVDSIHVRALINRAQDLRLSRTGALQMTIQGEQKDPQPTILVPTHEPLATTLTTFKADSPTIVKELSRILMTRFDIPLFP
jgi:hypothetical protein